MADDRLLNIPQNSKRQGYRFDWWNIQDSQEMADTVTTVLKSHFNQQVFRIQQMNTSAALYGNMPSGGLGVGIGVYMDPASAMQINKDRVQYNIAQLVVDKITARVAKNTPQPFFLTSNGKYDDQRKAKKMNWFIEGLFAENDVYDKGTRLFRESCIWGTEGMAVVIEHGRIKYERVLPYEIVVDAQETLFGPPRTMFRVKQVDRDVLAAANPEHADLINASEYISLEHNQTTSPFHHIVSCVECWHLPSGPDAKDGRHVVIVSKGIILDEPWEIPTFPIVFFSWNERPFGFWGQGLVEQIQSLQFGVNKMLALFYKTMSKGGSYKWLIENASKVVSQHLNSDIGAQIKYTGTKPEVVTPSFIPHEYFQLIQLLEDKAYEQAMLSQATATNEKPAGLTSGKALRTFHDIESDGFSIVGKRYEKFYLDLAKLSIMVAKRLDANQKKYKVKVPFSRILREVHFGEVDLPDDSYVAKCFPVSSLRQDPAGRLQDVQEMGQAGLLNPYQVKKLLQFPDLEREMSLDNAAEDWLSMVFDRIVDEGIMTPPEAYDNLELARNMAQCYYEDGKYRGLEEDRLELLRRYIDQVDGLMDTEQAKVMAKAQAAQALTQPPATPSAKPAAPAVSPLLPNVPPAAMAQ
jgi:hypothetical protein